MAGFRSDASSIAVVVASVDQLSIGPGIQMGHRNKILNGAFNINQRGYASAAAVGANLYGHDRWKMAASADTYTFSTTNNLTTVTIPAGKVLRQVIEGLNLQSGDYILSWSGTAQGKIGAGAYGISGVKATLAGGTDTTIEFGPGTVGNVQLEVGPTATPFEYRHIGLELSMCQRYYEELDATGSAPTGKAFVAINYANSQPPVTSPLFYKVTKRIIPTITFSLANSTRYIANSGIYTGAIPTANAIGVEAFNLSCTSTPVASYGFMDGFGKIFISAEL